MTLVMENLYNNLHRRAVGWDEDFLTEAFTHLLKHIQEHEPDAAYWIINRLTGDLPIELDEKIEEISISSQFSTDLGIPDICIKHENFIVLIEVKVDADFHEGQLAGYRQFLSKTNLPNVRLNTLTRYGQSGDQPVVDQAIRWNQVADWLERLTLNESISNYLRNEFVRFLKLRGVAMDKVEWELVPGIKSMLSLLSMISEAMASAQIRNDVPSAGKQWWGYYKKYEGIKKIFFGIYYSDPSIVCVETEGFAFSDDIDISQGEIVNGKWRQTLNLASEEIHFFARSKQSQLSCLEEFLRDAANYADQLMSRAN